MQMALSKNAAEFALQTQLLYAVSHFVTKRRKFINARFLIKSALDEFIGRLILDNADGIV
ncbi:hypothetical protein [Treponema pedis]|uniref:hypothetical protein n=1 Tax=Treponema pedis TaxID=409322 RepID=UPI000494A0D6|nr:hypothetical protein [Treponema pedis]